MSSAFWLDDIIQPGKKGTKEKEFPYAGAATAAAAGGGGGGETVILNEGEQKNGYYMDVNDNSTLHLQIETAEGPRIIPISGQHVITMPDGQQFLAGGVLPEEQPGFLHTVEGGQTFIINTEHGGQQIYQDSSGQQYIICDVPGSEQVQPTVAAEDPQFTNIDSYISKTPSDTVTEERAAKPVVRLPNGPDGEFITYEVDCQLEDGTEDKNVLDQEKLANLLNVLQTGEHGHALSNADLFILAPPDQSANVAGYTKTSPAAETGDIITNMKEPEEASPPTKYVAVKMKKSDLTVSNAAKANDNDCAIKSTKKSDRKITEYSDSFVKSKPVESKKEDWEYSVWSNTTNTSTAPSTVKRKRVAKKERSESKHSKMEQLTLDLGQRAEPTQCLQCGMVYTNSVAEDEQNHSRFHKRFLKASSFTGWKSERVVEEYHDGRIILVNQNDPKSHVRKMEEVREVVDVDLGITDRNPVTQAKELQAYLYISNANKVIAAAFVEHIEKGYPCISPHTSDETGKLPLLKTADTAMKAVCGVSRLWVFKQCRRKKVASRLMDCIRANFVFGCTISKVKIAFSDPTENGRLFAQVYCGTGNFLIYR